MKVKCFSISSQIIGHESTEDMLRTLYPLVVGDKIQIAKENNSLIEKEISSFSSVETLENIVLSPQNLTGNANSLNFIASSDIDSAYRVFDGSDSTYISGPGWVELRSVLPFAATKFGINITSSSNLTNPVTVTASKNGIDYVTLCADAQPYMSLNQDIIVDFDFLNTEAYSFYRVDFGENSSLIVYLRFLANATLFTVDTSEVTEGEIPLRAYVSEETLGFNDESCIEKSIFKQLATPDAGTVKQALFVQREYQSMSFAPSPTEVVTKVGVSNPSNRVVYVSYNTMINE